MKALIKILSNQSNNRLHPILYFQSPLPGVNYTDVVRWKSKGHHQEGFNSIDSALGYVEEMEEYLTTKGYKVDKDICEMIIWDGVDFPLSVLIDRD